MCGIFILKVADAQIGGSINKIVILFVTFQLAETQSQLKQFFDTGRVVNTPYYGVTGMCRRDGRVFDTKIP